MKVIIKTNFPFDVQNIGFSSHGELVITLSSEGENPKNSYRQLLKIPRLRHIEKFFFKLLPALRFFLESFYFFFNRIARYAQSKESRNLLKKIPQITCKAIFRSCLNNILWRRYQAIGYGGFEN